MVVVKSGCGLLGLAALKYTVFQEWNYCERADFLHADTNLGKVSYFNIYWVGMVKNGRSSYS